MDKFKDEFPEDVLINEKKYNTARRWVYNTAINNIFETMDSEILHYIYMG